MFCSNCGNQQGSDAEFCTNCGTQVTQKAEKPLSAKGKSLMQVYENFESESKESQDIQSADHTSTQTKTGFKTKRNILIIVGSLAILALLFSPRPITIELAINDVYGGVFDQNCSLTKDGQAQLGQPVIAFNDSGEKISTNLTYSSDSSGTCKGRGTLMLSAFGNYTISSGEKLSTLDGYRLFPTTITAVRKIAIKHPIRVRLNLGVEHDYCEGTMDAWTCYGGDSLHANGSSCYGTWGYSDIRTGALIEITGRSNGITTKGKLKNGTTWDLDSISSAVITCHLVANPINVPHDDEGYDITISDRGSVEFSLADLISSDWVAVEHLGD